MAEKIRVLILGSGFDGLYAGTRSSSYFSIRTPRMYMSEASG
jgi:hypothetical protein